MIRVLVLCGVGAMDNVNSGVDGDADKDDGKLDDIVKRLQ